ncbi:MAG: HAD-IA family hydrolase [Candidatus Aenigmarchaeota archaeon]|nr:HAD-IA family hydrolase [Candidatus Aenigmarchaeota archaeon]
MNYLKIAAWDLDGTLYSITPEIQRRVNEKIYQKISETKNWSVERSREEFHSRYQRLHGATASLMDLGLEKETMQRCLEEADILDLLEHDEKLVKMFNNLNYLRHILVTGSSRELATEKLNRIGLNDVFEYMITADDVKNPKPHPESIEKLLQYTGLPPQSHVWIDDRKEHALVARERGLRIILVGGKKEKSDLWVPKIYDIEKILMVKK